MFQAVIFDMDGLLIDSEPLWVRAEIEVFGEMGLPLAPKDCERTRGLRIDDVVRYWQARAADGSPLRAAPADAVEAKIIARMIALIGDEGQPLPGVTDALEVAASVASKLGLASSSPMSLIRAALNKLGLETAFEVVRSAEGETHGKPHPAIFLRTADALSVSPTACLVVEDSLTGVIAAKAARMTCVAVPMEHPEHDPRFVLADATIGSLAEFTRARLAALAPR